MKRKRKERKWRRKRRRNKRGEKEAKCEEKNRKQWGVNSHNHHDRNVEMRI